MFLNKQRLCYNKGIHIHHDTLKINYLSCFQQAYQHQNKCGAKEREHQSDQNFCKDFIGEFYLTNVKVSDF